MAFKSSSSENPLCRIIDMTDTNYEYDAPQFFDFARVNEEIFDDENDYFSIDHEIDKNQKTAATKSHPRDVNIERDSELSVGDDQSGEVNSHLDMQLHRLNLKKKDTAEAGNNDSVLPSAPKLLDSDPCGSPFSPSNFQQDNPRIRFVDTVTSAKKRLSMSVDRGQKKLARQMAALVGPAKRTLYTVDASPGLNQSMQHCLAHGEDDIQHLEQDNAVSAGPCYDSTTAENIVDGLMFGNAEMVEMEETTHPVAVPFIGIPFLPTNSSRTRVKPFSFEERNKRMVALKEEKIRKFIDAENKLREFHAQPFPEIIYSSAPTRSARPAAPADTHHNTGKQKDGSQLKDKTNSENNPPVFRAKPPTVLQKQPFIPQKPARHTAAGRGVSLKTEDRAARRAEWDKWKRDKELKAAEKKQEREREERRADEAEMKRLRQMTVHHARPVPLFIHRARPVPLFIRQQKKSDKSSAE